MKTMQKSWGNNFRVLVLTSTLGLVAGLVACETTGDKSKSSTLETSLDADKKELEELRKNIPEEKRAENDQLKEILNLMGEVKLRPDQIRDRFHRTTERMRSENRKSTIKKRDHFNKAEKTRRDEFFANLKKEREEFFDKKRSKEDRKEFTDKQDAARKEFTADERDKRAQFNSDMKQQTDDFNTMMRERNSEFTAAMREYNVKYNEYLKRKEAGRNQIGLPPGSSTVPLKAGDGDGQ